MRKKAQKTARENGAEIQSVLFIWMSVPWWVQTLFSALWDKNQTGIKVNKHPPSPIPKEQQEGMQEILQSTLISRAQRGTPDLDVRSTLLPTTWLRLVSITRQEPATAKLPSTLCLNTTSLSFSSSSQIRVCFFHERNAVHDGREGLTPDFQNTDLTSLKASLRAPHGVEAGVKAALMRLCVKNRRKGEKQTTQVHLFSNKRRNCRLAWPQEGAPLRR